MTITRMSPEGVRMDIELTEFELKVAYYEQERIFDEDDLKKYIESLDEHTLRYMQVTRDELLGKINEFVPNARHEINDTVKYNKARNLMAGISKTLMPQRR